ncbi:MAG TPA: gliding motility-associated ABC transporter substrate-binding protein GldG, partial [Bacteroidetes bacterium]|nr:gliding motility-associated ABC transporter substrate-binding protein GldG [Bacteroidota bacterium]
NYSQKLVIPGALIFYRSETGVPINLLNNESGLNSQLALNNSEAQLEYKISSGIKAQLSPFRKRISLLQGQGEPDFIYLYDFIKTLTAFYQVDTLRLEKIVDIKKKTDLLVIAQPKTAFSEQEKFKLDQFVMNGGKILWMLDAMNPSLDSLIQKPAMLALNYELNLEDQLFTYGVRLNNDLLMDLVCNPVPLSVNSSSSGEMQFKSFPCPYFPVLVPDSKHLIDYSIESVKTTFAGTLDTVAKKEIRKTVLLHSSELSRLVFSPWVIDFRELHKEPDQSTYTKRNLPVAVLLEGKFSSLYKNRVTDEMASILRDSLKTPFKEISGENSMIVIADGDFAINEFGKGGVPMSLGYYRYSYEDYRKPSYFENKKFLLNCIDYLLGNSANIETRGKQVRLRLLDASKTKAEKTKWQMINLSVPVILMILFGAIYFIIRIRRFSKL